MGLSLAAPWNAGNRQVDGANIPAMHRIRGRSRAVLAVIILLTGCGTDRAAPGAGPAASGASPAEKGYGGDLPPLPEVRFASARPAPLTRAAYDFAARHPEVLRQIPCFCGCERNGHGHVADCFVAKRDADGRPEWNPHGIGCGICIDIVRETSRLHRDGTAVAEIRKAIEAKYRSEYPTSTPTPPVQH